MKSFAIKVIDNDGNEIYVCDGLGDSPTRFPSHAEAQRQVDFLAIGIGDEVQAITVVNYPQAR